MKALFIALLSIFLFSMSCLGNVHLGPGQTYPNIEAAVNAVAIHPGDTVFLHAGSYGGYQGISKLKGNKSNPIVISRFENDEIDISGCWQFMSCEYIKFLNLNFKGNAKYPGRLFSVDNSGSCETQSKFIKVDSCVFSNATDPKAIAAFKFGGVDSFEVTNCIFKDMSGLSTMDYNVCRNGIIRLNRFENCLTGGHIKGGASNITMERNIFINASKDPWVAFELGGDTGAEFYCPEDKFEVKNLKFYSNIIIGGYRGLALSSAVDCKVINNTFYNCGQATMRFLTTSSLYPSLSGNRIENNIFAFGSSAYINGGIQPAGAASFGKNIYYGITNPSFKGPYWDTPDLDAIKDQNPMIYGSGTQIFADGSGNDFHLVVGSPALGKGMTETEPTTDFYGNQFSITSRSIGAIEIEKPDGINEQQEIKALDNFSIQPNPAEDFIVISFNLTVIPHEVRNPVLRIYNVFGQEESTSVCSADTSASGGQRIDVSDLPSGVYFVWVGNQVSKFIKI